MSEAATVRPLQRRIVLVGNGLAAWMAADALARAVRREDWSLRVVADGPADEPEPFEIADTTLPLADGIHFALETDEDRLVAGTGGSFTVGIALAGWSAPGAAWFHPFGSAGANLGPVAFHHVLMRLRSEGASLRLANFSLAALAAQAGRFSRPADDPQSVLSTLAYGLHLDCRRLAAVHRASALSAGVALEEADIARVERRSDGSITALVDADERRIEGDLFLDCTGSAARLAGNEGAGWEDWSAWLPCDRAMSTTKEDAHAPPPYSLATANESGWLRHLPLQGRSILTAIWSSEHASEDETRALLAKAAGNEAAQPPRRLRFGRRTNPWHGNTLALGSAAALIDPVATSNLQLLRTGLDRLLRLLPGSSEFTVEAAEYNRQAALHLDNARDFAVLHYRLNGRTNEPFWDACRRRELPASLEYRMRLYESRGRVALYDEEPLEAESWIAVFDECGVRPRRYHPIADGFPRAHLEAHVERVRAIMIEALARMPSHGDYLSRLQPSKKAAQGG